MPELVALLTKGRLDGPVAGATFSSVETPTVQFAGDLAAQFAATSLGHPVFGVAVVLQMRGGGSAESAEAWRVLSSHRSLFMLPGVDVAIGGPAPYLAAAAQVIQIACRLCSDHSRHGDLHAPHTPQTVIAQSHQGTAISDVGSQSEAGGPGDMPPGLHAVAEGFADKKMWRSRVAGSASLASLLQGAALLAYVCRACSLIVKGSESCLGELSAGNPGALSCHAHIWLIWHRVDDQQRAFQKS
jgi:hypothetical protein